MFLMDEVIEAAYILYANGLNTLSSGNVSARCSGSGFAVLTPSGLGKHDLMPCDLVFYDFERGFFIGFNKPTSEFRLHTLTYVLNPSVGAIAHAHNPLALKLVDERGLSPFVNNKLVESEYVLGKVCRASETRPGSEELAREVANLSFECNVVLIPRHGAIAFDSTPLKAVERLLALEYIARYVLGV